MNNTDTINSLITIQGTDITKHLDHNFLCNLLIDCRDEIADSKAMIYALESQIGLMKNYADAIDKENEQLQKYRDFVIMIASEQLELSLEKAQLQQRDWRSKAVTLTSQLEFDLNFDTEDTSPLDNDF
jgi:hypothetical protein